MPHNYPKLSFFSTIPRTIHPAILHATTDFRSFTILSFYPLTPNTSLHLQQPSSLGFYFHERCCILIEEAEMMGEGEGSCPAPSPPPDAYASPTSIKNGRREKGKEEPLPPFPLLLTPPPSTQTDAVDLPTGRAPLVRRLPTRDRDSPTFPSGCVLTVWVPIAVPQAVVTLPGRVILIPFHPIYSLVPIVSQTPLPRAPTPLTPRPGPPCSP